MKGYVLKLLLVDVHIKTVRNSVEDVKFIFTRLTSSVNYLTALEHFNELVDLGHKSAFDLLMKEA